MNKNTNKRFEVNDISIVIEKDENYENMAALLSSNDDNVNIPSNSSDSSDNSSSTIDILDKISFYKSITKIIKSSSPYFQELSVSLSSQNIAPISYLWSIIDDDSEAESSSISRLLLIFSSCFMTPINKKSVKIDFSCLSIGTHSVKTIIAFDENTNVVVITKIKNPMPPSYGICIADKLTIEPLNEEITITTNNWISQGTLKYSIVQINTYSIKIAESQYDNNFTIKNLPLGENNFYVEAYDIETGKTGLASCHFSVASRKKYSISEISSNLDEFSKDIGESIKLMDSMISVFSETIQNNKADEVRKV